MDANEAVRNALDMSGFMLHPRSVDRFIAELGEQGYAIVPLCHLSHGAPDNSATVYGHFGSARNCVKVNGVWVHSS